MPVWGVCCGLAAPAAVSIRLARQCPCLTVRAHIWVLAACIYYEWCCCCWWHVLLWRTYVHSTEGMSMRASGTHAWSKPQRPWGLRFLPT